MISDVHRRPLLILNFLPAMALWSWSDAVTAPKPLVWRDSGLRLSIEELVAACFAFSSEYTDHGIEVRELEVDVLKGIVEEAWLRLQKSWTDQTVDARRNAAAWEALGAHPEYERYHGYRHPSARFSSVWLRHLTEEIVPSTGEL
jgi:hypothetical protein